MQLKSFRNEEGVPEQLISESSLQPSIIDEPEFPRSSKDDSFLDNNTLIMDSTAIQSDLPSSIITRDDGYSTSDAAQRNIYRRSRHFGTIVPKKIRRTNSWN